MEQFILKREQFKEIKNEVLPYRTIDVIFNKKNVFVNLQNPNPVGIFYDIYDVDKWYQFLRAKDEEQKEEEIKEEKIWKEDIPSFYSFKIFANPFTLEEIDKMKKNILFEFQKTIRSIRNQKGLNSFFKTTREMKEILELYLIYLEMYQVGLSTKEQHIERLNIWNKYFIEKMNNRTKCYLLALCFNYMNDIQNYLFNCQEFLFKNLKDGFIMLVCKIFQYPNKVLSIRIMIMLCSKTQEDLKEPEREFYQVTDYDDEEEIKEEEGNKEEEPLIVNEEKKKKTEKVKKLVKIVRIGKEKILNEKQLSEKPKEETPLIDNTIITKDNSVLSEKSETEVIKTKPKKKVVKKIIKKKVKKSEIAAMKKKLLDTSNNTSALNTSNIQLITNKSILQSEREQLINNSNKD